MNLLYEYDETNTDTFTDSDQALLDELFGTENQDEKIAQWAGLSRPPLPTYPNDDKMILEQHA